AALELAGRIEDWTATGTADISREDARASVELDGRGNREAPVLRRLHAQVPSGTLDAQGELAWAPLLRWEVEAALAGFDPAYFAPGWNGAVDGQLASSGSRDADGALQLAVDLRELGGSLRGRRLS